MAEEGEGTRQSDQPSVKCLDCIRVKGGRKRGNWQERRTRFDCRLPQEAERDCLQAQAMPLC